MKDITVDNYDKAPGLVGDPPLMRFNEVSISSRYLRSAFAGAFAWGRYKPSAPMTELLIGNAFLLMPKEWQ